MAALFAEIEGGAMAAPPWPPFRAPTLGVPNLTVARLLEVLGVLAQPRRDPAQLETGGVLDPQIEAQVHGPIELEQDVELWWLTPRRGDEHRNLEGDLATLRVPAPVALWISTSTRRSP